ncbi:MAG TPA: energy transducer TonB [Pyrinomonadaceae bacterium]|jgi:TonB family protein
MKKNLFVFTLLILCLSISGSAQVKPNEKRYEFHGTLKDKDSAVFAGTPVFFNNGGEELSASTDINGEFKTPLAPGNYEVTVRKTLSESFKAYLFIQENGLNPDNAEFVIEPNPVCCGTSAEKPYPKIVKLPKPPYPAAARAVQAVGEVVVEVKIDNDGKVISANAVSGHPLLRVASVTAAKQSLFEQSAGDEQRDVNLTYVFFPGQNEKPNTKRYSNPYRVEIIGEAVTVEAINSPTKKISFRFPAIPSPSVNSRGVLAKPAGNANS